MYMYYLLQVISVDDTHLSSTYQGVLLLATAQDANGHIYPLSVAVVNNEDNETWFFFFCELRQVVPDAPDLYFVSDHHRSIGHGIRRSYSQAKHGFCKSKFQEEARHARSLRPL